MERKWPEVEGQSYGDSYLSCFEGKSVLDSRAPLSPSLETEERVFTHMNDI